MKILKEVIIRYQTEDGRIVKAYEQGELVRCKDCKYWDTDHLGYETMYCHRSDWNRLIRGAEDFCSRAERKEE